MIVCPQCFEKYDDNALYCNACDIDLVENKTHTSKTQSSKKLGCSSLIIHSLSFLIGLAVLGVLLYEQIFQPEKELNIAAIIMCVTFILWGGAYIFNHKIVLLSFSTLPLGLALFWIQDGVIEFGRGRPTYLDKEPIQFTAIIVFTIIISIIISIYAMRAKKNSSIIEDNNAANLKSNNYSNEDLKKMAKTAGLSDTEIDIAMSSAKDQTSKELERILDEVTGTSNMSEEEKEEFKASYRKKLDEL